MITLPKEDILRLVPQDKRGQMDREIVVGPGEILVLRETLYCGRLEVKSGGRLLLNGHDAYIAGMLHCDPGGRIDPGGPDVPSSAGGGGGASPRNLCLCDNHTEPR
jgi:hypothetical protein